MDTLYENAIMNNIVSLCKGANPPVSPSKMCTDLKLSKSLITKLKNSPDKTITGETASLIADYFGVSVDYVLGSEQKEKPIPMEDEQLDSELIMRLCQLTPDEIQKVDAFVQGLLASR